MIRRFAALAMGLALSTLVGGRTAAAAVSQAERAFARTVSPLPAHEVTGNLLRSIGLHVSFVCTVTAIVHPDTMIGQCGRDQEPVDMYVMTPTSSLHIGTKLRVMGEMLTPGQWVDVTGHSWFTAMMKAEYADRL